MEPTSCNLGGIFDSLIADWPLIEEFCIAGISRSLIFLYVIRKMSMNAIILIIQNIHIEHLPKDGCSLKSILDESTVRFF